MASAGIAAACCAADIFLPGAAGAPPLRRMPAAGAAVSTGAAKPIAAGQLHEVHDTAMAHASSVTRGNRMALMPPHAPAGSGSPYRQALYNVSSCRQGSRRSLGLPLHTDRVTHARTRVLPQTAHGTALWRPHAAAARALESRYGASTTRGRLCGRSCSSLAPPSTLSAPGPLPPSPPQHLSTALDHAAALEPVLPHLTVVMVFIDARNPAW